MEQRSCASIFDELSIKGFRPLRRMILVRVLPTAPKSHGGVWLPPTQMDQWAGPAHLRLFYSQVLAAGPKCEVKVDDVIVFQRLNFAWWKQLADGTRVGWIDETQVLGYSE